MSEAIETVIREALDDATATPLAESGGSEATTTDTAASNVTEPASSSTTADSATTATSTSASNVAAQADVDDLVKELGVQFKEGGRENRIPYSRVKTIVENARKKAATEHEAALKTHLEKVSQYEPIVQKQAELDRVIFNEPEKFLNILRTIPGYAERLGGTASPAQGTGASRPSATSAAGDPMPQPDVQLSDGSKTYSLAGIQKLMDWQAARVEAKVSQRYEPIEKSFAAHAQIQQIMPRVQAQIAEASKWPLFNEPGVQDQIAKALKDNPSYTLERAYQAVVLPRLQADRSKMREEVLAEINRAPRSTATTPHAPVSGKADDGPRSTEDIIREALKAGR